MPKEAGLELVWQRRRRCRSRRSYRHPLHYYRRVPQQASTRRILQLPFLLPRITQQIGVQRQLVLLLQRTTQ